MGKPSYICLEMINLVEKIRVLWAEMSYSSAIEQV